MKASRFTIAFAAAAMFLPGSAHALTCLDGYYKCLNDSWNTKGFERFLADVECGTAYFGCLRRSL